MEIGDALPLAHARLCEAPQVAQDARHVLLRQRQG
jgi:hypothetical protein